MLWTPLRLVPMAPHICTGFVEGHSREIRRTQGQTTLPRYWGVITATSSPFLLKPRPASSTPDLTHTLQALIMGMCPSTIAIPPTGAVPVEPREQKQSIVCSLHHPKTQALPPQAWSTK